LPSRNRGAETTVYLLTLARDGDELAAFSCGMKRQRRWQRVVGLELLIADAAFLTQRSGRDSSLTYEHGQQEGFISLLSNCIATGRGGRQRLSHHHHICSTSSHFTALIHNRDPGRFFCTILSVDLTADCLPEPALPHTPESQAGAFQMTEAQGCGWFET
jgi:hypothetical protein